MKKVFFGFLVLSMVLFSCSTSVEETVVATDTTVVDTIVKDVNVEVVDTAKVKVKVDSTKIK